MKFSMDLKANVKTMMKSIKFSQFWTNTRLSRTFIPAIILCHLAITMTLSKIENLWVDEAFSLHTTQYGVGQAISRALSFEEQPPVYFALLSLWRNINSSFFFARLFSVLCIFLSLLVFVAMSKKLLKDIHPGWIIAVIAFNPFMIWAAAELRCYALVILISTLLCKFFWDGYLAENPVERAKWYYAFCSAIALYTFYFLGFLLVANACALAILKRWRALRTYILSMMIVALGFVPLIWVVLQQVSVATETVARELTLWEGLTWVGRTVLFYLVLINSDDQRIFFTLARIAVLCLTIGIVGYRLRKKQSRSRVTPQTLAYLAIVSVIFCAHGGVVTFLGPSSLYYRYLLYIFPPLFLGVFLGLSAIVGKKGVIVCAFIMLWLGIAGDLVKFPRIKLGDWARVAAYIMYAEKPDQPILVYCSESALPLAFHYSGINPIIPFPKKMNLDSYNLHDFIINDENELSRVLANVLNKCDHFWMVTDTIYGFRGVKFSHDLLIAFIDKEYSVVTTKNFYGATVRLVQRK